MSPILPVGDPCKCHISQRPDRELVDAYLRRGDGLGAVAKHFGLNRGSLGRHRLVCLGIRKDKDTPGHVIAEDSADPASDGDSERGNNADPAATAITPVIAGKTPVASKLPKANAATARSAARAAEQDRVRKVADFVAVGMWRGWTSVVTLSEQWGISTDEVQRMHRIAARKVGQARGGHQEQLETSIAITRRLRDDAIAASTQYDREATDAYARAKAETDVKLARVHSDNARAAQQIAGSYRAEALTAQKHHDALTVLRPKPVTVQFTYLGNPEFDRGFGILARIYERLVPGIGAVGEEGIAVLEEYGEDALDAWLEQKAADLLALPAAGEEVT